MWVLTSSTISSFSKTSYILRHPERGLAVGHTDWNKPEYTSGNLLEWTVGNSTETASLMAALERDGIGESSSHSHGY